FQSHCELQLVMQTQEHGKIAMHWIQCCLILHNMILQFKSDLGVEKMTGWARREGIELYCPLALIVVDVPEGTLGQVFWSELMRCLFTHLGQVQ
ncbi:hypothetical protein L210DRAFT_845804, partial [Boletus edulis BED1]